MMISVPYLAINSSDNPIQLIGRVVFISGIMMGFASLSDISKISDSQKNKLLNPKYVKAIFAYFFVGVIILIIISILFISLKFVYPTADKTILNDFNKLGYDALVLLLGFLCLIKQFTEQVEYVKNIERD
jgi:uncharacterized protein YacL